MQRRLSILFVHYLSNAVQQPGYAWPMVAAFHWAEHPGSRAQLQRRCSSCLGKVCGLFGAGLRWQHTLARMKQASLGEQGCSLSHNATFHMREVSTQVTPKEQRTDKTYQNCFLPLAKQKLSKDTMTCRTQALKIRHCAEGFCSELSFLFVVLPERRAALCAQKACFSKDSILICAVRIAQISHTYS